VIAHRGASADAVENSLAAFELACRQGADGIELDVHATADGAIVVHHDAALGESAIRDLPLREVRRHRLANGEPVPTLDEALALIADHAQVFVEVKALPRTGDARLFDALDRGPAPPRYRVHSFDHRIIQRLQRARPDYRYGVLSTSYPVDPMAPVSHAGADTLWQEQSLVDDELVSLARRSRVSLIAWTADDPERVRALSRLGVDGVCTNAPRVVAAALA
jgi:glycerophosphoryl diester phosphodiesterase